jgi:hypothetical protein
LVYIIPPLVFIAGAFFLYRGLKAWRQIDEDVNDSEVEVEPKIKDKYMARLEEELKK